MFAAPAFVADVALVAALANVALVAVLAKVALVADPAEPVMFAVIVPAEKLPLVLRQTTVETQLAEH